MCDRGSNYVSNFRRSRLAASLFSACLFVFAGNVWSFQVQTGNPDVEMRFDNTVRANAAWRVGSRKSNRANNPAWDESDSLFDSGALISKRLDLLTEFDFTYRKDYGFRVSSSLWYDGAYGSKSKSNPRLPGANYTNNDFTSYVKRYYHGPSGEFLDSFVWGNFKVGETDLAVKFGRHALLWGEAVFGTASGNSVAFDMAPSDGQKQAISPGANAKELTLPIHQLTGTWQLTSNFSISGQYTYEWRPSRLPEGGTYFGIADAILIGPNWANRSGNGVPGGNIPRVDLIKGDSGDKGLALKWRPDFMQDGNFALYARRFANKTPIWAANTFLDPGRKSRAVFANDVSLWGLSFGSTIWANAVGAEISHRHNTPLNMNPGSVTSAAKGFEGPRGDTWHGLVNTTTLFNKTDYWTSAAMILELTYQKLDKITSNPQFYKSVQTTPAACTVDRIVKGCATNEAYHLAVLFSPVWAQVFPQTDLTGQVVYQTGLKGNAPTTGIVEGGTVFSSSLSANYANVNIVTLAYTNFWGKTRSFGATSLAGPFVTANGAPAVYGDRANISLTYSRTF